MRDFHQAGQTRNKARGTAEAEATEEAFRAVRQATNAVYDQAMRSSLARQVGANVGFRTRLTMFFADHFTVKSRNTAQRHVFVAYAEDAIGPHVNGYFRDMLRAVATHPMMLLYLEQYRSMGPLSRAGQRWGRDTRVVSFSRCCVLFSKGADRLIEIIISNRSGNATQKLDDISKRFGTIIPVNNRRHMA